MVNCELLGENHMLGDSSSALATASGDTAAAAATTANHIHEGGDGGGLGSNLSEEDKNTTRVVDESDRLMGYSANRWPRQETLALLKIRSDMDAIFRDSRHKGALWEEASRKLAELGYHRTSKKCKEKFENVFKYHKRTKEGRTGKFEGKTSRFFDQLEAFENFQVPLLSPPPQPPPSLPHRPAKPQSTTTAVSMQRPIDPPPIVSHVTVPSTQNNTVASNISIRPAAPIPTPITQAINPPSPNSCPSSFQNLSAHFFSGSTSSTASDEKLEGGSRKRKRKWEGFLERLTKDVLRKQEKLHKRFLETVERHERERIVRQDARRMQEMARINREHEILIQERSAAMAKDAAIITFLQRMSGQEALVQKHDNPIAPPWPPEPAIPLVVTTLIPAPTPPQPQPRHPSLPVVNVTNTELDVPRRDNRDNVNVSTSSSRWPKAEVHALISLRTSLDVMYQQTEPKGPLWEEISAGLLKLGYNRSAKRCKEKWENINKYFKKVKESTKKRPEDSKTCPYFHQLDALYKEKSKNTESSAVGAFVAQPVGSMEPLMVQPEQQWPPPAQAPSLNQSQDVNVRDTVDKIVEEEEGDDDYEDEEEGDTEEEDEVLGFEVVPNKASIGNGERDKDQ